MGNFRKSSYTKNEHFDGRHRFEHWYRDNSVYFITSKVREGALLFATERDQDYFDGCIRDVLQAERAYRYTLLQAVRARLVKDWREYPHTHVNIEMDVAIRRASQRGAYMEGVPYARYERNKKRRGHLR